MILIGLSGKMGVGKSTAVKLLTAPGLELVKLAGPLYEIQEFIYNRISSVYPRPEGFVKDRKLLQFIGTDWGRNTISDTIWIDLFKAQVNNLKSRGINIIICDDVRFENEVDTIRALGGRVIKIVSSKSADRIETLNTSHASEAGIPDELADAVIINDSSLEDFKNSLFKTVDKFLTDQTNSDQVG